MRSRSASLTVDRNSAGNICNKKTPRVRNAPRTRHHTGAYLSRNLFEHQCFVAMQENAELTHAMLVGAHEIDHGQQELLTQQIARHRGAAHRMQSELPTKAIFANLCLINVSQTRDACDAPPYSQLQCCNGARRVYKLPLNRCAWLCQILLQSLQQSIGVHCQARIEVGSSRRS
jgi:hypothetical protein